MIEGISHLTFIVKDLERSAQFFKAIFNAEEIYDSGENTFSLSKEKYLSMGGLWICIMEGESLSERTYNHIAFKIPDEELGMYEARIKALGLEIRPSRPRVEGEGQSLYFYDYDNHLFELHTGTLTERLARYHC
ncbi:MAG: FosX/FosE/FosI family fosfomycin resistance hydrolase [Acidobacteriota bacterium]